MGQCLLYLVMMRPPVREEALDCAEGIWRSNERAKGAVGKVLAKWQPEVLVDAEVTGPVKAEEA